MHFHPETPHALAVNQRLRGTPVFCGFAAVCSLAEARGFRYGLARVELSLFLRRRCNAPLAICCVLPQNFAEGQWINGAEFTIVGP